MPVLSGLKKITSGRYSLGLNPNSQRIVWISLTGVVTVSVLNLTGWIFNITLFKSIADEWIPMRVITAICLILSAVSFILIRLSYKYLYRKLIPRAFTVFIVLVGTLTVSVNIFELINGREPSISNIPVLKAILSFPARMALVTAVSFILTGIILILFSFETRQADNIGHILNIPLGLLSFFIPVSYIFGVSSVHTILYIPVALNTGIVFFLFSLVLFLIRPDTWFMRVFTGDTTGSTMARRLLLALIFLPVIVGWFRIVGEHKAIFKSEVGVLLVAMTYVFCFIALVWLTARSVNITDEKRKKAEEALRTSESNLRAILDATGESIYMFDRQGKLVVSNLTGITRLNSSMPEVIGHHYSEFMSADLAQSRLEKLEKVFGTKEPVRFEDQRNELYFSHSFYPVFENGEVARVVTYSQEISERKKAENELIRSRQEWIETFDMIPDLIAIIDTKHNIVRANKAMLDKLGVSSDKAIGTPCYKCVHGASAAPSFCPHTLTLLDHKQHIAEVHEERLGGDFIVSNTPIFDNQGNLIGSVHVARDISDRKRAEEAIRSSEERVRVKLESLLSPEGDIGNLSLADIIDTVSVQELLDNFYQLARIPVGIIDADGIVLVKVGWQDICTKFHRVHENTCRNCIESDTRLTMKIPEGEFKLYKCKNGMHDMATPIIIGGKYMGNLFLGQFFFYDEPVDYEYFRLQSIRNGFDEKEYFASLAKVPRISRTDIESAKGFFLKLTHSLAQLSYSNIKLARNITEQEMLEKELQKNNERLDILSQTSSRLLESDNPQKLVNELCLRVMKFLNCDVFFNFLTDDAAGKLHLNACAGIPESTARSIEWLDFGVAVCGCVARDGERIIAENIQEIPDPRTELIKSFGVKAYACHPLLNKGKVIGTLSFGTRRMIQFNTDDISLMKAITDQVAIAMSRERNEEELRKSEMRFRTIAESLPVQISISRTDNSTIVYTNEAYDKAFGYKRDELIGKSAPDRYFNPEDRKKIMKLINDKGYANEIEIKTKRADGSPLWILASLQPIIFENIPALSSASVDITERKRTEAELLQLNRTLNSLGKSSQVMMHAENEMQYINDVCRIIIEDCGHLLVWIGYLQDDEEKSVLPVAYSGFDEGYINELKISWSDNERGRGPTGTAIRTGKPALCTNILTDPQFDPWRKEALKRGYASSIVLPLISEGVTFGAISIYSREPDPFSYAEINLLSTLANDLAYGISYLRLIDSEKKASQSIKESEEKFRQLFDGMTEGFALHEIITDKKGVACDYRFLSVNPAFEKQTGLRARDILGKKVTEVMPDTEQYWIESYGKVALTGESIEFENYASALNKYFRVSSFSPRIGFFAVIFEDITNRVLAEKELQETRNYLENLINYSNTPIIVWNKKNEIQRFNRAFEHLTGYESSEVFGKKIDILFSRAALKESKEKIRDALTENLESIEIPIQTKNNEIRTVLWNSAKIYDNRGKVISTIAQGNDITERIKAEKAVNAAKIKLDIALENGNIGIWEWDLRTDSFEVDERMRSMLGGESGSSVTTYNDFEKHIFEEDLPHLRLAFSHAVDEEVPLDTLFRTLLTNEDFKYISTKALVQKDIGGKPIKMSGVCFDITAMKKGAEKALFRLNEDLLRSNKELEQFAYIASHDLQEPLRMVSSFTQLLSMRYKDKLDTDANEFIQYAVDGAARMQGLINDLLEYSRIETRGKKFSAIDMHAILGQTIKNLSVTIKEKNALVINDDLPVIIADEGQMVQMFQNLVGNALKFCKTSPRIHISVKEDPDSYIFSVKDNGIGMEPQYFNKIFQIFQRLGSKDEFSGTGIGLAICKRIAERHKGKIWVESKPNAGSNFYFSISKNLNND